MASAIPPVKGSAFTFYTCLVSQADTDIFQTSVTLAAGDVQVSKGGGAFVNVATLPTEIGTSGLLSCPLSADEMNDDIVVVKFTDAADDEWQDQLWVIYTAAQTLDTIDSNVDAVLLDTGTDGVVLANDAITSAKFDEATAFPLASADSGATEVARTGADGDTLETLSDEIAVVDGIVDDILADTGTDGVVLANDAITSAKFDEATAFPLASADSGATEVARTGADGDTLETLSDQVDGVTALTAQEVRDAMKLAPTAGAPASGSVDEHLDDILEDTGTTGVVVLSLSTAAKAEVQAEAQDALEANDLDHLIQITAGSEEPTDGSYLDQIMHKSGAQTFDAATDSLEALQENQEGIDTDVWTYVTRTLTAAAAAPSSTEDGDTIELHRGDTFTQSITDMGDISARSKLWFTIKTNKHDKDTEAIAQVEITAGLLYINGAAATASDGSITEDDAVNGDITVVIKPAATVELSPATGLYYDVQVLKSTGVVQTLTSGSLTITADVTRATS